MTTIEHHRRECIGCGACVAIHPRGWEMADDGKSHLIGSTKTENGNEQKTIADEQDEQLHKEAAESCPTSCIRLTSNESQRST